MTLRFAVGLVLLGFFSSACRPVTGDHLDDSAVSDHMETKLETHLQIIKEGKEHENLYDAYYVLSEGGDSRAIEYAHEHLKSSDPYLWLSAAHYLGTFGKDEAVPFLIKGLRHTAFRGDAARVEMLQAITGQTYEADFRAWREWWVEEASDDQFDWKSNLGPRPRMEKSSIRENTQRGKGSVGKFIVDSIGQFGGEVTKEDGLTELSENWYYSSTSDGVELFIFDEEFGRIAHFLKSVLGAPNPELGSFEFSSALKHEQGFYSPEDKNVLVRYVIREEGEYIQVDVIRP